MNIDAHNKMTTIAATAALRECVCQQVQCGCDAMWGIYPVLTELGLTLARDKTWIGRVATGFDFLGYRLLPDDVTIAVRSFKRMTEKLRLLYEQGGDPELTFFKTHLVFIQQEHSCLNNTEGELINGERGK